MISADTISLINDYYANVILTRPSDLNSYSRQWFAAQRAEGSPKQGPAFLSLRHLIEDNVEFRGAACTIFCEQLSLMRDAEAEEISVEALQSSLKRLVELEVTASTEVSMSKLEATLNQHIPSDGTISFGDFVSYMHFAATFVSLRIWLHRLWLFSADINDGVRQPYFDRQRLNANLTRMPFHLRSESKMDTAPWIAMVRKLVAAGQAEPTTRLTPDDLFEGYMAALIQKALMLRP